MREVIHTLRKPRRKVIVDGRVRYLHEALPLGSKLQDPDTPQREAAQVRAFQLADEVFWQANRDQHQVSRIGDLQPVLAVWEDKLVLAPFGFITEPAQDLEVIGYVDRSPRTWTAQRNLA
jgi:hypothetical protein